MKIIKNLAVLSGLVLASTSASAVEVGQSYFNVEYSHMTMDFEGDKANPGSVFFRVGKQLQPNFAIEAFFGLGLTDDEIYSESFFDPFLGDYSFSASAELSRAIGVQGKFVAPINYNSDFFFAFGINNLDIDIKLEECASAFGGCDSLTISDDDTDITYSLGVNFGKLTVSYNMFYDDDSDIGSVEISGLNIGYHAQF